MQNNEKRFTITISVDFEVTPFGQVWVFGQEVTNAIRENDLATLIDLKQEAMYLRALEEEVDQEDSEQTADSRQLDFEPTNYYKEFGVSEKSFF